MELVPSKTSRNSACSPVSALYGSSICSAAVLVPRRSPCELDIKVIGDNEGPFVSDIRTLCAEITGQAEDDVQVRWRDKGKYRAITLRLKFQSSEQVYAVYAAMDRDPRVRYKL